MTVRRASLLGLAGLVFAVYGAAFGCNLDATGIGETGDLCTTDEHCDDQEVCTVDVCDLNTGVCKHEPVASGTFPDGVTGNCKIYECEAGKSTLVFFADDVDDGNDCTQDACSPGSDATHMNLPKGTVCTLAGGLGTCDGNGTCTAECGFIGEDGAEVGCPAAPNGCTLSYCDKAQGVCVTELLDGIPAPGTPEPGECGGTYCINGEESAQNADKGTACLQADGSAGVCSGTGECFGCNDDTDCADAIPESECHDWVCMGTVCANTTEPDGPLASQVPGDCQVKICVGGNYVEQPDASDPQSDGKECTTDTCDGTTTVYTPLALNTPCGQDGSLYCDGMGICKGCLTDMQCKDGTECKIPKCDLAINECYLQNEPDGKVINMQTPGDCINNVCDMNGNIVQAYYPLDPQNDSQDCTVDTCTAMNQTSHTPAMYGSTCDDGGGVVCDATAHCVGKPCSVMGDCPAGTFCVDGVCCDTTCNVGCNACTTAKKGTGQNGLCDKITAGDPDGDCPGNSACNNGICLALPNGAACLNVAGECASGNCVDGFCCVSACNGTCLTCAAMPGNCTPIVSGQDPQNECMNGACDGAGVCRKDNGQACPGGAGDCLSNFCVDGVCCNNACTNTCQACNVTGSMGTCANVPNNTDPADECLNGSCNGGGQCKLANGQVCASGGDCLSGACADGVCCTTACGSTCQSCLAADTGGTNGTCANVTAATDPSNECTGVTNCNGSGACTKLTNGTACTLAGECMSGNCVDGVCCNTTCTNNCQACNVTGSIGTCANIPSGTDPGNDCTGNSGADVCNGAGVCKEINGTPCAAGSECLSAVCADGVCCGTTCNGTCQACNISGAIGTCTNVANGQDPANECVGVTNCNGAGACTKLSAGSACTTNGAAGECLSTFCVDGVCCNVACSGLCEACVASKTAAADGTCAPLDAGTDPDNECAGTQVCNGMSGAGSCKKGPGDACGMASECASGFCADGVCCDAACTGTCDACTNAKTGMPNGTCTTVTANTDPDNECTGGLVCSIMGTCVAGPDGMACGMPGECASGNCVDGYCCNSACNSTCAACSAAIKGSGANGVCDVIANGQDPGNECIGVTTCNGSGGCTKLANGLTCTTDGPAGECQSTHCVDGVCCDTACTAGCNACTTAKKGSGANGVCGVIANGQDPDDECIGVTACNGSGGCAKLPNGSACTTDGPTGECQSTNCVDGVCCNTGCGALCESCNLVGLAGTCTFIPNGMDPDNECAGASTCDGNGACTP